MGDFIIAFTCSCDIQARIYVGAEKQKKFYAAP